MTIGAEARSSGTWGILVAVGVLSIVAGVLAIVWPDLSLLGLALIAGINMIVLSALMIGYAVGGDELDDRTLRIIVGVLGILAGILVVRHPGTTLLLLIVAFGLWMVLTGLVDVIRGVLAREPAWGWDVLGGLAHLALGVCMLALPKLSLTTVAVLIGISFIVRGLVLLVGGWHLRSLPPTTLEARPAS